MRNCVDEVIEEIEIDLAENEEKAFFEFIESFIGRKLTEFEMTLASVWMYTFARHVARDPDNWKIQI